MPHDLYCIIGSDWSIDNFKEPERIKKCAKIIEVYRPDSHLRKEGGILHFDFEFNISSTLIRGRIKAGKTIKGLVTPRVEEYIHKKGFYK
jgi:nicotinic acid mononucleotide adenylyltransferase